MMLHDSAGSVQELPWREIFPGDNSGKLESQRLEYDFLIPLRAREQQMLGKLGAAHPTIQALQREISILEERITVVRELEKLERADKANHYGTLALPVDGKLDDFKITPELEGQSDFVTSATPSEMSRTEWMASHWLAVRLNAMKESYLAMERHEKDLQLMAQEELKKSQELQNYLQRNTWLKDQLASVKQMLTDFSEKVKAVELVPNSINHRILKELNPATIGLPAGPYPSRYIVGGAALGLLLMSGLAILMDLADRSYRSPDEIVADLGKPILGHIPAMELPKLKKIVDSVDASVITLHHSRGRISEAFRSVRTCLFFSSRETELKVIQVTSPVPG
ncbi:MAG TPA: hypothetical protein PKA06_16925, partial [Gemmatales bacterium]|nr:hypothetical protein [Gemmatales bacterium]